ncbi:MAG: hypothetical protein JEZ07_16325 [Phycisphaerae bacterium]|nr:hypothetical protein [Phycisphaerae bacterium]
MIDTDQNLKEYDYKALHTLSLERGHVRASSKMQAKKILKKHGYRWFSLWQHGATPCWYWDPINPGETGGVAIPFVLKKKEIGNTVTYGHSRVWPIIISLITASLSGALLWVLFCDYDNIYDGFLWKILVSFILLLGLITGVSNFAIIVDKVEKKSLYPNLS